MSGSATLIKRHIKAKTPEALEKLQLVNNHVFNTNFDYTDITFANGFWYAWFTADIGVIRTIEMLKAKRK